MVSESLVRGCLTHVLELNIVSAGAHGINAPGIQEVGGGGGQEGVKIYTTKDHTPGIYLFHLYSTS